MYAILTITSHHDSASSLTDLKSVHGAINNLMFLSPTRNILYATDAKYGNPSRQFEHLSCFFPGLLALGASALTDADFALLKSSSYPTAGITSDDTIPLIAGLDERLLHQWAAEGMAYACWLMYADEPSGLAPDAEIFYGYDHTPIADGHKAGRWIDSVRAWVKSAQAGGRFGGINKVDGNPPGVNTEAKPMPSEKQDKPKDYVAKDARYLMRPEVRTDSSHLPFRG